MIREMDPFELGYFISKIATLDHVEARLFEDAYRDGHVAAAYDVGSGGYDGVLTMVDKPDYMAIQAPYAQGIPYPPEAMGLIRELVDHALRGRGMRQLFLKTNRWAADIRKHAEGLGFSEYNAGWELRLDLPIGSWDPGILEVRGYDAKDCQAYIELLDDAFLDFHLATGGNPTTFRDSALFWMDRMETAEEQDSFHGYWFDGEAVGLCVFNGNVIQPVAVHPKFQGKGYGREIMLRSIARTAPGKVWDHVCLFVVEANPGAKDFYIRLGFKVVGEYSEFVIPGDRQNL